MKGSYCALATAATAFALGFIISIFIKEDRRREKVSQERRPAIIIPESSITEEDSERRRRSSILTILRNISIRKNSILPRYLQR